MVTICNIPLNEVLKKKNHGRTFHYNLVFKKSFKVKLIKFKNIRNENPQDKFTI